MLYSETPYSFYCSNFFPFERQPSGLPLSYPFFSQSKVFSFCLSVSRLLTRNLC